MKIPWKGATRVGIAAGVISLGIAVFAAQAAFANTVGTATPESGGTALSGSQSSTQLFGFTLSPTAGQQFAFCSGSSAGNQTEEESYLVPSSVSPASLTYTGGNVNGSGNFMLFDEFGNPVGPTNTASSGQVQGLPTDIEFGGNFLTSDLVGKTFNVGIACAVPPAGGGASTVSDYWNTVCTFVAAGASDFTWSCTNGSAQVPESPLTVGLPLGGAAVIGTGVYINRRRRRPVPPRIAA